MQLSRFASSGDGTQSNPYQIDFNTDVWPTLTNNALTALVVDGIFDITESVDVPPQYTFVGPMGRPASRGSVIKATSSMDYMFKFVDDGQILTDTNGGGAIGVSFLANANTDTLIHLTNGIRNRFFNRCSFRGSDSNGFGIIIENRKATFTDCDIAGMGNWAVDITPNVARQITFRDCRFASNEKNIRSQQPFGLVSLENCVFTNNTGGTSVQLMTESELQEEAMYRIHGCTFTDNPNDWNFVDIGAGPGTDLFTPVMISDCHFEGYDRTEITSSGNKAIIIRDVNYERGVRIKDVTGYNFTNTPIVDNQQSTKDGSVRINGVAEVDATPSASDYTSADAGLGLIDKSTTAPYDRYQVLQDGTLDGPY